MWPHEGEVYASIKGEFFVVDCMGDSLTFRTGLYKGEKLVGDTYDFIASHERVV